MHIILIVALLMGGGKNDVTHEVPVPTIEQCFQEAQDFMKHDIPDVKDAVGLAAQCMIIRDPTTKAEEN